ncbi:MAG TPA: glycosyltransferase family 10 [Phycisphaerales bacterium]|nr:glycosyltransferase family 10 [Phycisphaerales bacterium]
MTRVGLFNELIQDADYLWNQCEQPAGRHHDLELARWDREAPHRFIMNWPSPPFGTRKAGGWKRYVYKALRKNTSPLRVPFGYEWLGHDPARTTILIYEPPALIPEWWMDLARTHCARVYAPDPRATHPIVLPSMWTFEDDIHTLRALPPNEADKVLPLVAISSGKPPGKSLIEGHLARLEFYRKLRAAGVDLSLFGRGLPGDTRPRGPVASKANVLRPARCALVIENYAEGDMYVTEKLWDALICWALPLYFGPAAPERLIPPESFIRLPDLADRGVETVRRALADTGLWRSRLEAIAEARRRAMGDLRLVEWIRREIPSWMRTSST